MTNRAFITGITGQDGSYLAELLIKKGYEVHGLVRRTSTGPNLTNIDHIKDHLHIHYGDMTDCANVRNILLSVCPNEIYNLAAQSHVGVSFQVPASTGDINGIGVLHLLEATRILAKNQPTRFYQASTSELYGKVQTTPQTETTPFYPRSPYAVAKLYAYWMTVNYRESYNLFACNGILFNHESPRRGSNFVTNKVVKAAVRIKLGLDKELELGNLDAYRDWGHSKDYVRAMHMILNHTVADDFVVATGETRSVRDMCKYVFETLGMDYQEFVIQNPKHLRPEELPYLKGDSTKVRTTLGWKPEYTFEMMMDEMIEHWMRIYKK